MAIPTKKTTVDGFEMQFAINHRGPFLLTAQLLRQAPRSRAVNVSRLLYGHGTTNFDDLESERRYSPTRAYSQSKLSNLLLTFDLRRRSAAGDWSVIAAAAHPGGASTDVIAAAYFCRRCSAVIIAATAAGLPRTTSSLCHIEQSL